MTTQVEELAGNRVRLRVEVPKHDVEHAVEHAASDLAASLKIPGFRKGKVPMPVLLARVGKERLMAEAVESHIAGWFLNAAARSRIRPVAQPEFDFELPDSDREAWSFTATVDVQPMPELPEWTGLEVPRADAEVPSEAIDAELEVLRHGVAELAPVEGRPAQVGDTVVLDLVTPEGDSQRDYVVEVGSGRLLEEIERGLIGMSAGETKEIPFELGDDAGTTVQATLKEIKEKVLPPLDDDLARAASEFETLSELRADIEANLQAQLEDEAESAFRGAAADALVEAANVEAAGPLVESRTRELVSALSRSLERRGITLETYLALTGGSAEELVERMRAEAAQSVARELVLEVVADELGIEVGDEEIEELIRSQAEAAGDDPEEAASQLAAAGAFDRLREDLRLRKALDRVAADVKPIPVSLARAREKLWTPEQEKTPADTKLWTPGSKEHA